MAHRPALRPSSLAAALSSLALLASGCTAATPRGMTASPDYLTAPTNPALKEAVTVTAVRGGDSSRAGVPWIASGDFEKALVDSLRRAGYLAPSAGEAQYTLEADIVEATIQNDDRPFRNLQYDENVTSTIRYRLRDVRRGVTLLDRRVEAPYTAANGTGTLTATRIRVADEGSARESIEALVDELHRLRVREGEDGQAD